MQPLSAGLGIGFRLTHGVQVVDLALLEVAIFQAHAGTVEKVDSGDDAETHGLCISRKLRSREAPAAADRSGWNCAPQKFPLLTTALKGWP